MQKARTATADQWSAFFTTIAQLVYELTSGNAPSATDLLTQIGQLIDAANALNQKEAATALTTLRAALPTTQNPTARDWAGFFAALADAVKVIIPLIAQFFVKP